MNKEDVLLKMMEMLLGDKAISTQTGTGYEKYLGKNVFIRTVTHHYTGHVTEVATMSLTMQDAAWIADDGRLNESLKDPEKFEEVEPYVNPITVSLYSILEVTEISKLITEVK